MKKPLIICLMLFLMNYSSTVNAQHYNTGIGGRFGDFSGFTIKHFISNTTAIDGLISFGYGGFLLTGLYEIQKPIVGVTNLDWYIGIGGHIGSINGSKDPWAGNTYGTYTAIGIDFVGGLEYSFSEAPFSIGLDWKPAINIIEDGRFWPNGFGLSIRYNF